MNTAESVLPLHKEQIADILEQHAETLYRAKAGGLGSDGMATLVRLLMLKSIDTHWVNHLTHMENLRTGVGLQAVGQRNPLTVDRTEGQCAFAELNRQMQREITHTVFRVTLAPEPPTPCAPSDAPTADDAPGYAERTRRRPRSGQSHGYSSVVERYCRCTPSRAQDWPQRQVPLRQRPQVQALLRRWGWEFRLNVSRPYGLRDPIHETALMVLNISSVISYNVPAKQTNASEVSGRKTMAASNETIRPPNGAPYIWTSHRKVRNTVHVGPPNWTKSRTFVIRFTLAL